MKIFITGFLAVSLSTLQVMAQSNFVAIPADVAPKYRFDLGRNYFPSPDAEVSSRKVAYAKLEELETLKGRVAESADNLYRALGLADEVQLAFYPHLSYLYLRFATNTKDEASRDQASTVGADVAKRVSFLQQELMRIDEQTLARFVRQKPELQAYAFAIESARRYAPHTLSLKEEELLRELTPLARDWTAELFQRSRDRTDFGKVHTSHGELDVYTQEQEISNNPDRAVREEGFKKQNAGYAAQRDLYAFALNRLVRAANRISKMRGYKDNADETHFAMFLKTPDVRNLYEEIAKQGEFYKRFERARVAHIKKTMGYADVNYWDLSALPPGVERPRFPIAESTRILEEALAPLGPEYNKELSALLDPANGRLDVVGGQNRVPGAFADGFLGHPVSIFYSFNYEGYFDDVDALAHEAGHAVHFQLMGNNKVRPAYGNGPNYFTEAFAMFNELLVLDRMYRQQKDEVRRGQILEQFLLYALYMFNNTRGSMIEQAIYDAVGEGRLLTADELDALAKGIWSRFSIWPEKHDELKMRWIAIHHLYDNPMYYPNYVYAALLAVKFFEMYNRDPKGFVPRYLALLRNGFDAPPSTLLKKFLDVDLQDPRLVTDSLSVLEPKLRELETLYSK